MYLNHLDLLPTGVSHDSLDAAMFRRVIKHLNDACGSYRNGLYAQAFVSLKLANEVFECLDETLRHESNRVARMTGSHRESEALRERMERLAYSAGFVEQLRYYVGRLANDAARACRVD